MRWIDDEKHEMNSRRFVRRKDFVELPSYRSLARRVTLALDVGRILKQRQHAALCRTPQTHEDRTSRLSVGVGSTLKSPVWMMTPSGVWIASATQSTRLCVTWIGWTVKGPTLKRSLGRISLRSAVVEQSVFFELVFDVGQRELGAPYRYVELRQHPGKRADVVLVPVGQNDSAYPLAILKQIGDIGHDNIDAQQFGFREHQAGIDDDNVVTPANGHTVHAELAQSAQWYYL